jgi:hypothetical protein
MKQTPRPNYREERAVTDEYNKNKKAHLFFPFQIAFEKLFGSAVELRKYINGN